MASTDEKPGLLARFYGSRQESSTRRKSAERPFPHNVQRGSTTAANCLYPDTTRGRRNVGRVAETLTSRQGRGRKDPFTGALERDDEAEMKDAIADESGRVNSTDLHALDSQANAAQFPELAARAQASDEILACAAEQLEIYNRVHDARLFGIRADGGVIFSLVSLAVTFYVFVFFWMFGIDAGR